MTLWDILESCQYMQVFSIYSTNIYGQNIPVARGTLSEMQEYDIEEGELFSRLMDKVDYFHITKNGVMVVFLQGEHYEERVETLYSQEYVERWERYDPKTRPWLFVMETEEYTDEWICRFPCKRDKAIEFRNGKVVEEKDEDISNS